MNVKRLRDGDLVLVSQQLTFHPNIYLNGNTMRHSKKRSENEFWPTLTLRRLRLGSSVLIPSQTIHLHLQNKRQYKSFAATEHCYI
jgi:hypothetical protein